MTPWPCSVPSIGAGACFRVLRIPRSLVRAAGTTTAGQLRGWDPRGIAEALNRIGSAPLALPGDSITAASAYLGWVGAPASAASFPVPNSAKLSGSSDPLLIRALDEGSLAVIRGNTSQANAAAEV